MARVAKFTPDDAAWRKIRGADIFTGDVIDSRISDTMGVGYCRQGPGEQNDWTVSYDEVFVCLKGEWTIETKDGETVSAGPGEVLWLEANTPITYKGTSNEETVVIYITYPLWRDTEMTKKISEGYWEEPTERPVVNLT